MILRTPTHAIIVLDSLGSGDAARLYACQVKPASATRYYREQGAPNVFKIAAKPAGNEALRNEATTLQLLTSSAGFGPHQPFVPRLIESFEYVDETRERRRANVLAYDAKIESPRELYSLLEVRAAYRDGLDARDAAWIFRRLLNVLAAVHDRGVAHNAVTPAHVLIEPNDHKLVLVGWSNAGGADARPHQATADPLVRTWRSGYDVPRGVGRSIDLTLAARTMIFLLGGDWLALSIPDSVEPSLRRFLERCAMGGDMSGAGSAAKVLADFDRLIESAWGKRAFRPFSMPSRVAWS